MAAGSLRRLPLPAGRPQVSEATLRDVYARCLSGQAGPRTTATAVYTWARSPFAVWCNAFAPASEKDPPSDFMSLLFKSGRDHETRVVEARYPQAEPVAFETKEEGFRLALEAMASGTPAIHGAPVFWTPDGLLGIVDVLERRDTHASVFGQFHYVVKEIKVAKNLGDPHRLQGAFYNFILARIQGFTPEEFFLINRDDQEFACKYKERELRGVLRDIRAIHAGVQPEPVYGGGVWPWEGFTDRCAVERQDVSLVSGVGPAMRKKLVRAGFLRVEDLARGKPEALAEMRGIGETKANRLVVNAKALSTGRHIQLGDVSLPKAGPEVFLDLEGSGEQQTDDGLISMDYLIGTLSRAGGRETYRPFIAHSLDGEERMFRDFIAWFEVQHEALTVYHRHHYEATHLRQLSKRYGLKPSTEERLFASLVDLYKVATRAFAFPTYGNGLKDVAPYMGFRWRQDDVNAMESIALYFEYLKDPKAQQPKLQRVLDYNEDDCRATRVVKDWLAAQGS